MFQKQLELRECNFNLKKGEKKPNFYQIVFLFLQKNLKKILNSQLLWFSHSSLFFLKKNH